MGGGLAAPELKHSGPRALPRVFAIGAASNGPIELPKKEIDMFRKVLRLSTGDRVGVLPNDGSLIECEIDGIMVNPIAVHNPKTESPIHLTVAQALPKGDKLEEIVRACTSIGVSHFVFFPSDRTVVRWDAAKWKDRLRRLAAIAMETCEVAFRMKLPTFEEGADLDAVLKKFPSAQVLHESERVVAPIRLEGETQVVVVGPEGGWTEKEGHRIGDHSVSLGPRVLRVEHAAAAAAAVLLLRG